MKKRGYKPSDRSRKHSMPSNARSSLATTVANRRNTTSQLILRACQTRTTLCSEAEYTRLLQAAQVNVRDAAIIELFLQTGIRLSELVGLNMRDVTLATSATANRRSAGSIRIGRGGVHVMIPLNDKAQNALRKWLEVRDPIPDTALFLTAVKKPIGKRAVQLMLEKYLDEAGIAIPRCRPCATRWRYITSLGEHRSRRWRRSSADSPDTLQVYQSAARKVQSKALQENTL